VEEVWRTVSTCIFKTFSKNLFLYADVMIMPLTKLSYTSKLHVIQIFPLQVGKTNISRRKGKGKPPTQSTKPVGVGDILVPLKLLIRWIIPSLKLTAKGPEK